MLWHMREKEVEETERERDDGWREDEEQKARVENEMPIIFKYMYVYL